MSSTHKDITFKKPTGAAKRKKKKVLEEETYVEEIGKIIQRDFFPDLEKITAQKDYLDAVEKNDTVKLKELCEKYSDEIPSEERIPSPATFETPPNIHNSQEPQMKTNATQQKPNSEKEKLIEKKFGLDQYLNVYTSQDNESFQEILKESKQKHKEKYSYLYKDEEPNEERQQKLLSLPSIEQQAQPIKKKFNLDTWGYINRNFIMFNPDGMELTNEEIIKISKNRKEIVHSNTRLNVNPFNEVQSKETISELAKVQAKVLNGKIGVDGKEILKSDSPQVKGFNFVRSPSPSSHSLLGSPLMTWGEIESTPLRLDSRNTPIPRSSGTSFKISEPPKREQLAHALAEKVGEKNRDQKRKNLDAQRRQLISQSPRPNTSVIDRLATMSPAAKKLATSQLKLVISSPSPMGKQETPSIIRTPQRISTPVIKKKHSEVSTDNLLKLSLPMRHRAQDFF